MSRDLFLTIAVSVALAAWVTTHVALSVGLMRRPPRWRGALGLVLAPLAPVFGFIAKLRVRSALWVLFAVAYAVLFWQARA